MNTRPTVELMVTIQSMNYSRKEDYTTVLTPLGNRRLMYLN